MPGDYEENGIRIPAIFRKEIGWCALRGVTSFYFGAPPDQPMPADYNGDGHDDIGIFLEGIGLWLIKDIARIYYDFIKARLVAR